MGIPAFPFFGDMSKAELEKELEKVKIQRDTETDPEIQGKLDADIAELEAAIAERE